MRHVPDPPPHASQRLRVSRPSASGPIRFSLDDVPEQRRPEIYREFVGRSVCRFDVELSRDVPFAVDVMLQALPDLQLFSGKVYGSCNRRTRALLADGVDDFSLMVNLGGPYRVSQGDRELVLADGEATLVSLAELVGLNHHPPGGVLALCIPRARLAPLIIDAEDCCLRPIRYDTVALGLLKSYVDVASQARSTASRELQQLVATHVHHLVAVALGATRDAAEVARDGGVRAARLHAIKRDIAGSLDQPGLSVTALAARHGCTPRYIQRLFETEGTTFTEYVLAQRLARAHGMLSDPRHGEGISTIAYDCGFGDLSYFNRVFRRRFGTAPSDVRAQARQAEAEGPV
jgi:AraC-like DNA-binding protein